MRERPGGVAVLAINAGSAPREFDLSQPGEPYRLTATGLESSQVLLDGLALKLGTGDALPPLVATPIGAGVGRLPPISVTFLAFPRHAIRRAVDPRRSPRLNTPLRPAHNPFPAERRPSIRPGAARTAVRYIIYVL
jgi:hypothetical protein